MVDSINVERPNSFNLAGPNSKYAVHDTPAGFWAGLWHGWLVPFTFLASLFDQNIKMYEPVNNGRWYVFGFLMGIAGSVGGTGSAT